MTQPEFFPFTCQLCGGRVELRAGAGRTFEYERGVPEMPIPEAFEIPTCGGCGEKYLLPETIPELRSALKEGFMVWQSNHIRQIVDLLVKTHRVTKRQVASVLGVTPSHLSHILAGSDSASVTLIRLAEALAHSGTEFRRFVEGRTFAMPQHGFDMYRCVEVQYISANDDAESGVFPSVSSRSIDATPYQGVG